MTGLDEESVGLVSELGFWKRGFEGLWVETIGELGFDGLALGLALWLSLFMHAMLRLI